MGKHRIWHCLAILFLALSQYPARADDSVEALRLTVQSMASSLQSDDVINLYKQTLSKRADDLKTIDEMFRALSLDDWKPEKEIVDPNIKKINIDMRAAVGERLQKEIRRAIEKGDADIRLALANHIAEIGPTIASLKQEDRAGYMRLLTMEVIDLAKDRVLAVKQEGLRALGNINARTKDAVPVFREILGKDAEIGPRRLAADGLGQLVRVAAHLERKGAIVKRPELIEAVESTIRAVSIGLKDGDVEVQTLSLNTMSLGAQAVWGTKIIDDPFRARDFAPPGQKLTESQRADYNRMYKEVEREVDEIRPVVMAMRDQIPAVRAALDSNQPAVQLAALRALEDFGVVSMRIRQRVRSLQRLIENQEVIVDPSKLMIGMNPFMEFTTRDLPAVAAFLRHPDLRLRRAAGRFFEVLEEESLPVLPALVQALSDSDRFIRLGALKTLGFFPGDKVAVAIPAIAVLLSDYDIHVRNQAAFTIEALGPRAKDAVPALSQAILKRDVEARQAAMLALQKIPVEWSKEALPSLIECIKEFDPRVALAAVQTIGRMGPAAASAVPHLRQLLGHENEDVRRAASGAILSIVPIPK